MYQNEPSAAKSKYSVVPSMFQRNVTEIRLNVRYSLFSAINQFRTIRFECAQNLKLSDRKFVRTV